MSLILSGTDGLSDIDGTAATPAIRGTDANTGIFFPAADTIAFAEGGAEVARFDSSGNLGIGTSSPGQKLAVSGGSISTDTAGSTATPSLMVSSGALGTAGLYAPAANTLGIVVSATERMRIDSSGNLLLGTTSQVSQGKGNIAFNGSSHQGLNLQETANQSSAGFMYFQYNTTVLGTITRNASTNAVQYNTTSDIRLKENIENANSALTTISNIKVRQYDWIGCEDSHQDYGFIAQELVEVVSGIVTKGRTEEDIWAVDYGKLTPILCKAIQEQQALITALTARIEALETQSADNPPQGETP